DAFVTKGNGHASLWRLGPQTFAVPKYCRWSFDNRPQVHRSVTAARRIILQLLVCVLLLLFAFLQCLLVRFARFRAGCILSVFVGVNDFRLQLFGRPWSSAMWVPLLPHNLESDFLGEAKFNADDVRNFIRGIIPGTSLN